VRLAIFGASVISDYGNPAATTVRAIMRALVSRGHQVIFLEERRNRPTLALLRDRGAAALRAFSTHAPDVHYRTYELPAGVELTLWLSRELATVDAVVLLEGTPPPVCALLSGRPARHLVRIAELTAGGAALLPDPELMIAPIGTHNSRPVIPFGPAVLPAPSAAGARSSVLLVSYDDDATAASARAALSRRDVPLTLAAAGMAHPPNWPFVPEIELAAQYHTARLAVLTGIGTSPYAAARALLPLAAGCPVIVAGDTPPGPYLHGVVTFASVAELPLVATQVLTADAVPVALPAAFDASRQAERLISAITHRLQSLSSGSPY
jgi:hypothetical protein